MLCDACIWLSGRCPKLATGHQTLSLPLPCIPSPTFSSISGNGVTLPMGFPGDSDGKESSCNAGDMGLIPELGRSPGGGQGNPLQYSCLENPMERSLVGYSPWGCKRVRHNLATNQQQKSPACKRQVRGAACGAQSQHHRANRKAALKLRDSRLLTSTVYSFGYLNACVSC